MKLADELKKLGVMRRQKVTLKSGIVSDFYLDIKRAYGEPKVLNLICRQMAKLIDPKTTCIAGAGYGGLPFATALSQYLKLKLVMVRERPKDHGRGTWIDGYVPGPNDEVAIVDDVLTTGGGLKQTLSVLKKTRAKISGCYVIVNRAQKSIIRIKYLLTAKDFLDSNF